MLGTFGVTFECIVHLTPDVDCSIDCSFKLSRFDKIVQFKANLTLIAIKQEKIHITQLSMYLHLCSI